MKYSDINRTFPVAKINSVSKGPHSKTNDSEKSGGLIDTIYICNNSKVMISVNLCVKFGLFNGSVDNVKDTCILYMHLNGRKPPALPDVVMVDVPNYSGLPFITEKTKVIPILPIKRKIECRCNFFKRKQIPLILGWATTIQRCHGMTIGEGVAVSSAKSTGKNKTDPDFAWHPSFLANVDKICHKVNTPKTVAREKEIKRIKNIAKQTAETFQHLKSDDDLKNMINIVNFFHTPEE